MQVVRSLSVLALVSSPLLGAANASAQNDAPAESAPAEPAPELERDEAEPPSAPAEQTPAPPPRVLVAPPAEPEPAPESPPEPAPLPPAPPVSPLREPPRLVPEPQQDRGVTTPPRGPKSRGDFVLELGAGLNARLGGGASYREEETVGTAYGAAFYVNLAEAAALGLELQHADLGRGTSQTGQNLADVEFSATTAWLAGRFVPFRSSSVEAFVVLRAGLSLQHVDAHGVRQEVSVLEPARGFSCTELDGPGLSLGGGLGARFGVGRGFSLVSHLDGAAHRLSSEPLGRCAVGVGSSTSVGVGLGLAYEFGGAEEAPASARPRSAPHTW